MICFSFSNSAAAVSVCLYETGVINRNLSTWLIFELSSFVDFGKDGDPTNLLDRYWARIEVNKLKVFLFAYFLRLGMYKVSYLLDPLRVGVRVLDLALVLNTLLKSRIGGIIVTVHSLKLSIRWFLSLLVSKATV